MIKRKRLLHLIRKYVDGTANARERRFVEKYYRYFDHKEELSKDFSAAEQKEVEDRMLANIHAGMAQFEGRMVPIYRSFRFRLTVAVVLALIVTGASFWYFSGVQGGKLAGSREDYQEVIPERNKAVLTLANGSTIALNQFKAGMLATQGYTQVIKKDSGQLVYKAAATEASKGKGDILYNTLTIPPCSNYRIVLPDGSKVWLNATSSLRFPTAFQGRQRRVEVKGEAYFEVTEDPAHPFIVGIMAPNGANMGSVKVLGTHFNINAYMDHAMIKTTLVDGAIKIIKGSAQEFLQPGEQATIAQRKDQINVAKVDASEAIAWKNGFFRFEEDDIADIMHEVARWYDVDVSYNGRYNSQRRYSGMISRQTKLSELLKILEASGFRFKVTGRKIIVNP